MSSEADQSLWYDEFWEAIPDDIVDLSDDTPMGKNGARLVRLWGEAFRDGLIWRDGDDLVGRTNDLVANRMTLDPDDQRIIRRIEAAACAATREVAEHEKVA